MHDGFVAGTWALTRRRAGLWPTWYPGLQTANMEQINMVNVDVVKDPRKNCAKQTSNKSVKIQVYTSSIYIKHIHAITCHLNIYCILMYTVYVNESMADKSVLELEIFFGFLAYLSYSAPVLPPAVVNSKLHRS